MSATTADEAGGAFERAQSAVTDLKEEAAWQREVAESMLDDNADDQMDVMRTVQMIGGAVIGIAVITIVVNQLLTTDIVANTTGPFDGVIDSLSSTGVAAMTLLVVGLLVAAASRLLDFFGGGF